ARPCSLQPADPAAPPPRPLYGGPGGRGRTPAWTGRHRGAVGQTTAGRGLRHPRRPRGQSLLCRGRGLAMIEPFTAEQGEAFERDGFLVVEEGLVSERGLELLRERYEPLFDGEYETGIRPDEVNWVPGRDPEDRTRQLCNACKSDNVVAAQVLSERTGRLAA